MAETFDLPNFDSIDLPDNVSADDIAANRFTQAALERHKREGLVLAVRARWVALAIVAIMIPILNPSWDMLYYEFLMFCLAGVGWLQQRVGRVGRSGAELGVLALDIILMTFALVFPNPFAKDVGIPTAMIYQFENFQYFFIILALGTLSYSWRTILAVGNWTAASWLVSVGLVWWFGTTYDELTAAAEEAFGHAPIILDLFDPNSLEFDLRFQQIVVFLIVSGILALSIRRFNRFILGTASLERERENLSRYFSPNVVDALSQNDEPLKEIRSHDVAVIFVDIQGFTSFAAERSPEAVIGTLREFHEIMEQAVFAHGGTLDKFLGDGLMATFGTPLPAPDDVRRAYHCVRRMVVLAEKWNAARVDRGQVALGVSVGLHYGPVVVGDIGGARLEYAVIGNTVNVASRLEALTRPLGCRVAISEDVANRLPEEEIDDLQRVSGQTIRGLDETMTVLTLA
ncbi:MAG: adenylate/guanylate cyclase domain-containing protein [Pseudomonadota bacterium]